MKREDAIKLLIPMRVVDGERSVAIDMAIEALREMSVEEYRQRLMELFHITDHDELITFVVMPEEKEFKLLESILRQYKFEPRLHGEWKTTYLDHVSFGERPKVIYCSNCNSVVSHKEDYCEFCGSDNRPREGGKNEKI